MHGLNPSNICLLILLITVGGVIFGAFLTASILTPVFSEFILALPVSRYFAFAIMVSLSMILGLSAPGLIVILVTVPLSFPIIFDFGFDAVWFSILIMILREMDQIASPLAIGVYILQGGK